MGGGIVVSCLKLRTGESLSHTHTHTHLSVLPPTSIHLFILIYFVIFPANLIRLLISDWPYEVLVIRVIVYFSS